jgi:hypothetical protein
VDEDELLSPDEVARILKVNVSVLAYWRKIQAGPDYTRLGRQVVYPARAVREFRHEAAEKASAANPVSIVKPGSAVA